jgi:hypothetical protein
MAPPATMEGVAETLQRMATDALGACVRRGWRTDWSARGCHLHLEASELIEACRGKGDSTPAQEAGDVLLVLLSLCAAHNVSMAEALAHFDAKLAGILAGTVGAPGGA